MKINEQRKGGRVGKKQGKKFPRRDLVKKNLQGVSSNYGEQLESIMKKGFGATLRDNPEMANFLNVYSNPFTNETAELPVFPQLSTMKQYTTSKGTLTLNSNGIGFITYAPIWSVANDVDVGWYSSGPTSPNAVGAPGDPDVTNFQMKGLNPIAYYAVGSKAVRLVGSGMRIRYIGKEYDKAGQAFCAQLTQRGDTSVGMIQEDIEKQTGYKIYSSSNNEWHAVTRHITAKQDEFFWSYRTSPDRFTDEYDNDLDCVDLAANMVIYITGTPGQTYQWEVQSHFSVKGSDLFNRTQVIPRPGFVNKVISAYNNLRVKDNSTPDHSVKKTETGSKSHQQETVWDSIKNGAQSLFKVGKEVLPFLTTLLL